MSNVNCNEVDIFSDPGATFRKLRSENSLAQNPFALLLCAPQSFVQLDLD